MASRREPLEPDFDLDRVVRRIDEDRWFASRFAPGAARYRLVALYALNYEIARVAETVTQPQIGGIKLAWWREALTELATGRPARAHPVLAAFATAATGVSVPWDVLELVVEARGADMAQAPFATWADLEAYVDATTGGLARVALALCGARAPDDVVRNVGRAWGYAGLARAQDARRARGRSAWPDDGGAEAEMLARAEAAYGLVHGAKIGSAAFPALSYVTLVPSYLRALRRGRADVSPFRRQLKLIAAAAVGRF